MSNTGYKNISASYDEDGVCYRLQVCVAWKGQRLYEAIPVPEGDYKGSLIYAITRRNEFERQLRKPRTERWIRLSKNRGVTRSKDKHGNESWCARWNPELGVQKRKHFSIKKYGSSGAWFKARAHRARMYQKYYAQK